MGDQCPVDFAQMFIQSKSECSIFPALHFIHDSLWTTTIAVYLELCAVNRYIILIQLFVLTASFASGNMPPLNFACEIIHENLLLNNSQTIITRNPYREKPPDGKPSEQSISRELSEFAYL